VIVFKQGMPVSIQGGPFAGCRGIVAVTPEQNEPSCILVTVERMHTPGPDSKSPSREPYATYEEHWIARQHCWHVDAL